MMNPSLTFCYLCSILSRYCLSCSTNTPAGTEGNTCYEYISPLEELYNTYVEYTEVDYYCKYAIEYQIYCDCSAVDLTTGNGPATCYYGSPTGYECKRDGSICGTTVKDITFQEGAAAINKLCTFFADPDYYICKYIHTRTHTVPYHLYICTYILTIPYALTPKVMIPIIRRIRVSTQRMASHVRPTLWKTQFLITRVASLTVLRLEALPVTPVMKHRMPFRCWESSDPTWMK